MSVRPLIWACLPWMSFSTTGAPCTPPSPFPIQPEKRFCTTVDGLYLDGCPLTRSTLFTEGAGTAGYLLGGTLDGLALPASVSAYNEAEGALCV